MIYALTMIPINVLEFCKACVNREYFHVHLWIITVWIVWSNFEYKLDLKKYSSPIMKFICSPKLCKICEKINKQDGLRKITGNIRTYCEDLWFKPESKCCNLPADQSAAWNINQWAKPKISDGWNFKPVTLSSQTRYELFKHIKSNGVKRSHHEKDFLGALIIVIALILFCFFALLALSLLLKIRKFILKKMNRNSNEVVRTSSMIKRKSIFEIN